MAFTCTEHAKPGMPDPPHPSGAPCMRLTGTVVSTGAWRKPAGGGRMGGLSTARTLPCPSSGTPRRDWTVPLPWGGISGWVTCPVRVAKEKEEVMLFRHGPPRNEEWQDGHRRTPRLCLRSTPDTAHYTEPSGGDRSSPRQSTFAGIRRVGLVLNFLLYQ